MNQELRKTTILFLRSKIARILLLTTVVLILFTAIFFRSAVYVAAQTPGIEVEEIQIPDNYSPETGINVTLSPVFLSLATDPGKSVSSQFRVTNNNTFTEYFKINLVRIEANQDGTSPVITDISPNDEFKNWIEYTPSEFELNPNQSTTIRVTVTPPADASLGYYYALVVSRLSEAEGETTEPGARVSASAAISILLNVNSPNAKREIQIVDFTTDKLFYEYLPATFNIRVKNSGNVHLVPFGDIFIDSMTNEQIAVLSANSGGGNVLPGIDRVFSVSWDDGFAVRVPKEENGVVVKDDKGNTVYETKFDFTKADKFRIGRYTANLIMVYDNGERDIPIEAAVSFWVIPWKFIIGGVVILLLVILGLWSIFRTIFRRKK